MTWDETKKLHLWLPESSEGWHQHPNGGGWVYDAVMVPDTVLVGERALIWGGMIEGGTIWGGTIWGGTIRGGTIDGGTIRGGTIDGGTILGGTILGGTIEGGTIEGGTIRGGTIEGGTIRGGTIRGGTIRGGTIEGGTIEGGRITFSPLLIYGSRYFVGYAGDDLVSSGCITEPLSWWLDNVERCAEEHGYSEQEQREYRLHIEHIAAWMRLYGLDREAAHAAEGGEP